ncbi:hypothetical protein F4556_007296 [Kitasatospora gansuensis]|uniref:Secreted protein n=1 Tax=Kitasatospora gansuensis TaxID=258050 RepID=A0A7W7SM27_9ACTN|nr:hypothetical protein [Kitasatospora gansuensis]MBB4951761.1 hypothetical protein [Kitasatospora gansuensis]
MTRHPLTRRWRGPLLALAGCLLAAGCGTSDPSAGQGPVTRELARLTSSANGLYYPPFLRDEPSGAEDNSYAVRIRQLLGGKTSLTLSEKSAAFLRSDALAVSPLWGRSWLAPLATAGAGGLLTPQDAVELRALRTPGGWFADPEPEPAEDPGPEQELSPTGQDTLRRAAATAAALDAIRAADGLTAADRTATLPWLLDAARAAPSPAEAAELAHALRLFGERLPPPLTAVRPAPATDPTTVAEGQRYQVLLDSYAGTRLAEATGRPSGLDAGVWAEVLRRNADSLGYRDLYLATAVARAAGATPAALGAVAARLDRDTLPDGTVRDPSAYTGSPEAALWGLRLRALAGEPTEDAAQAKALREVAADPQKMASPAVRLSVAAALKFAGPDQATAATRALCGDGRAVPGEVTPETAEPWSRAALACAELDAVPADPAVTPWALDTPERATAAATLVTTLADIHDATTDTRHSPAAAWVTAAALQPWATAPERFTSVGGYATVARAYLLAGGSTDDRLRAAVGHGAEAYRGCAQLPDLYRADTTEPGCDLKATWAAWKLRIQLGSPLPPFDTPATGRK